MLDPFHGCVAGVQVLQKLVEVQNGASDATAAAEAEVAAAPAGAPAAPPAAPPPGHFAAQLQQAAAAAARDISLKPQKTRVPLQLPHQDLDAAEMKGSPSDNGIGDQKGDHSPGSQHLDAQRDDHGGVTGTISDDDQALSRRLSAVDSTAQRSQPPEHMPSAAAEVSSDSDSDDDMPLSQRSGLVSPKAKPASASGTVVAGLFSAILVFDH